MENVLYEPAGENVHYCEPFKHEEYKRGRSEGVKSTENPLYESAAPYVNVRQKPPVPAKPRYHGSSTKTWRNSR